LAPTLTTTSHNGERLVLNACAALSWDEVFAQVIALRGKVCKTVGFQKGSRKSPRRGPLPNPAIIRIKAAAPSAAAGPAPAPGLWPWRPRPGARRAHTIRAAPSLTGPHPDGHPIPPSAPVKQRLDA
jgi:hypothetical protein